MRLIRNWCRLAMPAIVAALIFAGTQQAALASGHDQTCRVLADWAGGAAPIAGRLERYAGMADPPAETLSGIAVALEMLIQATDLMITMGEGVDPTGALGLNFNRVWLALEDTRGLLLGGAGGAGIGPATGPGGSGRNRAAPRRRNDQGIRDQRQMHRCG